MTTNSSNVTENVDLCSNVFSKASVYYRDLQHENVVELVFIGICVALSVVSVALYTMEFSSKRHRYREPGKRLKTLILLGVYPMTSFMASFSLLVPRSTVLLDLLNSCYLTRVSMYVFIYMFMSIMIKYFAAFNSIITISSVHLPMCIYVFIYMFMSTLIKYFAAFNSTITIWPELHENGLRYLSLCIYVFMSILVQYFGGFNSMLDILGQDTVSLRTPPCCCCCCCFPQVQLTRRNLYIIKGLIVQVAVIQPFLLFINAVVWADDATKVAQGGPTSPFLYVSILSAITTLLGLYGLQISVRASQIMLGKHRIKAKYSLLQLVILFSNLQKAIFVIFSRYNMPHCYKTYGSRVRGSVYHHMVLTAEMLMLAVIARHVYRKSESRKLSMTHVTQVKQKKLQKEYSADSMQVSETFEEWVADEQKNGTSLQVENVESKGTSYQL